jgi:hypothetical protein
MTQPNLIYKMIAPNGAVLIDDAIAHANIRGYGIVIRENTIIAAWLDSNGNNLITLFDIAAATLLVTDPALMIPNNLLNGSITLTSGSIWMLL